jgi:hypothetical protein
VPCTPHINQLFFFEDSIISIFREENQPSKKLPYSRRLGRISYHRISYNELVLKRTKEKLSMALYCFLRLRLICTKTCTKTELIWNAVFYSTYISLKVTLQKSINILCTLNSLVQINQSNCDKNDNSLKDIKCYITCFLFSPSSISKSAAMAFLTRHKPLLQY